MINLKVTAIFSYFADNKTNTKRNPKQVMCQVMEKKSGVQYLSNFDHRMWWLYPTSMWRLYLTSMWRLYPTSMWQLYPKDEDLHIRISEKT